MTWFRVDDTLEGHPKAEAAGATAMGLWVLAGAWSSRHLTDGLVSAQVVRRNGGQRAALCLVRVGLWHAAGEHCASCEETPEGHWRFHDWGQCNPESRHIAAARKRAAERKRRWIEAHRGDAGRFVDAAEAPPDTVVVEPEGTRSERVRNASCDAFRTPTPTRPDPTPVKSRAKEQNPPPTGAPPAPQTPNQALVLVQDRQPAATETHRGSRLTEAWRPSRADIDWARERFATDEQIVAWTEKFIRYWMSKAGRDGAKLRWDLTWRNWVQEELTRAPRNGAATPRRSTTDDAVAVALALAAKYAALEAQA